MYYKLEIYGRNGNLENAYESKENLIVLREYAQAMQYYYEKQNKMKPILKSVKCSKVPYSNSKEWKIDVVFDDGVIYNKYRYYFQLKED